MRIAAFITSVWVSGVILTICHRIDEFIKLPLNELGDFLAGAFGPPGFAWLLLGYFLQGKHLAATMAEMQGQAEEAKRNQERQDLMLDPLIKIRWAGDDLHGTEMMTSLRFENLGDPCKHIAVEVYLDGVKKPYQPWIASLVGGDQKTIPVFEMPLENYTLYLKLKYIRQNGSAGSQKFIVTRYDSVVPDVNQVPGTEHLSLLFPQSG